MLDCIHSEQQQDTFAIHATATTLVTQLRIKDQLGTSPHRAMKSMHAIWQDHHYRMGQVKSIPI